MQGVRWIMKREEPNGLVIIQQGQPKYLDKVFVRTRLARRLIVLYISTYY